MKYWFMRVPSPSALVHDLLSEFGHSRDFSFQSVEFSKQSIWLRPYMCSI
jgi:hypothetical protein